MSNFQWGWMDEFTDLAKMHKNSLVQEIFIDKCYEQVREVKTGDVVLDIGASIGPFAYSILHKNPKQVICVEPSHLEHDTLNANVGKDSVSIIKKAIGPVDGTITIDEVFGANGQMMEIPSIRFDTMIKENNIERINFLKTDCEGGEYDIFNVENLFWIKDNVDFVVGEWHLNTPQTKEKFRKFRDLYLKLFPNHQVYAIDGTDIKWDLWNEHFIEFYNEVIIHIEIN
jgi:FkbM family methyltransferase